MAILKIKNANGEFENIPSIVGEGGGLKKLTGSVAIEELNNGVYVAGEAITLTCGGYRIFRDDFCLLEGSLITITSNEHIKSVIVNDYLRVTIASCNVRDGWVNRVEEVLTNNSIATKYELGGVKVGDNLTIDRDGVLSADLSSLEKTLQDILTIIRSGELTKNQVADIEELIVSYFENKSVKEVEE